jgi:hypothetical protein
MEEHCLNYSRRPHILPLRQFFIEIPSGRLDLTGAQSMYADALKSWQCRNQRLYAVQSNTSALRQEAIIEVARKRYDILSVS